MNNYQDIINLEHKEPNYKHPRMTIYKRSSQFAPFAALSGFSDQIKEEKRLTSNKIELTEEQKEIINNELLKIIENKDSTAKIVHFIKDKYKFGGTYITTKSKIKRIDNINRELILINNDKIRLDNIIELSIENIDIS